VNPSVSCSVNLPPCVRGTKPRLKRRTDEGRFHHHKQTEEFSHKINFVSRNTLCDSCTVNGFSFRNIGAFRADDFKNLVSNARTGSGAHPAPNQWILRVLSPGVKWSGREADHSPPSCAEVKNGWSYTSMAWCLVKQRDSLSYLLCSSLAPI
jgi:hypothetical protein